MKPAVLAVVLAASSAGSVTSDLSKARDAQDRAALERLADAACARAKKENTNAGAQYECALASSYSAEIAQELKDKGGAKRASEIGIKAAQNAVALKPNDAENYRVLGTLYGQAIQDVFSALSYGKKSKENLEKAKQLDPKSAEAWLAEGVGFYYTPATFGGGPDPAMASIQHALSIDPANSEAWLWLGLAQRKKHDDAAARKSFEKSLELNPNRVWAKQQLAKTPAK